MHVPCGMCMHAHPGFQTYQAYLSGFNTWPHFLHLLASLPGCTPSLPGFTPALSVSLYQPPTLMQAESFYPIIKSTCSRGSTLSPHMGYSLHSLR
eukprot:1160915-Pelagomonas_calceolata.AAC.7